MARRIYRQLCGLVQRPSETSAVIAHFGRCWSGNKANPGTVYDPEVFRQVILPRLGTAKLSEIAGAAGCSKAYASDIRRGKWTPHVSTWKALARLARVDVVELGPSGVDSSLMEKVSCVG